MSYLKHKVPETLEDLTDGDGGDVTLGSVTMKGHIIPSVNASGWQDGSPGFDIGSAEYKIRHLFLSDNSLWIGDGNKLEASSGTLKSRKLKATTHASFVPDGIANIVHTFLMEFATEGGAGVTLSNRSDQNALPAPFEGAFGPGVDGMGYALPSDDPAYVDGYQQAARNEIFRRAFDHPKQSYLEEIASLLDTIKLIEDEAGPIDADVNDLANQNDGERVATVQAATAFINSTNGKLAEISGKIATLSPAVESFAQTLSTPFPEVTSEVQVPMYGTLGTLAAPYADFGGNTGMLPPGIGQPPVWDMGTMQGTLGTLDSTVTAMDTTMGVMQGTLGTLDTTMGTLGDNPWAGSEAENEQTNLVNHLNEVRQANKDIEDLLVLMQDNLGGLVYSPSSLKDWGQVLSVLGSTYLNYEFPDREWDHATKAVVPGAGLGPMKFSDMYDKVEDLFDIAKDFETDAVTSHQGRFRTPPASEDGETFTVEVLEWDLPVSSVHGGTFEVFAFDDAENRQKASHYTGNFVVTRYLNGGTGNLDLKVAMTMSGAVDAELGGAIMVEGGGGDVNITIRPRYATEQELNPDGLILSVQTTATDTDVSFMGVAKVELTIY